MNKIIELNFKDVSELAKDLIEKQFENEEINVIVTYDCINELLKELVSELYINNYKFDFFDINFGSVEFTSYDKEYLLSIDEDWNIYIEPFWREKCNDYLMAFGKNVYVQKGINLECLHRSEFDAVYSFNISEFDIARKLEEEFYKNGAKSLSFNSIVAKDKNSALAHYSKSSKDEIIKDGSLILIDCGAYYSDGLATDITRVFVKGEPNELQKNVYTTVLKAFLNAYHRKSEQYFESR